MAPPYSFSAILVLTTTYILPFTMAPTFSKLHSASSKPAQGSSNAARSPPEPANSPPEPDSIKLQTVYLGRESSKIAIKVPTCPSSSAKPATKAHAFTLTETAIKRHLPKFDFAELSDCLSQQIPGDHAYAEEQIQAFADVLCAQPFLVDHLAPIGFPTSTGQILPLSLGSEPAHKRPPGLMFLRVNFTVDFHKLALETTSLESVPKFHGYYDIPLPQSSIPQGRTLFPTPRTSPPVPATPGPMTTAPPTGLVGAHRSAHCCPSMAAHD